MKKCLGGLALAGALLATTAVALADNIETLGNMQSTGAKPEIPLIPQTGPQADAIRQTLTKVKLPAGFHIALYALVPDARHIAVGPRG